MHPGSVFWDIGANVGVLTLYAATRGDLRVWAFEPAAVKARAAGPMPAAWIWRLFRDC